MAQIVTAKNGQTNGIEYPRTVKSALLNDDGTPLNPLTQTNIINDLTTGGETNVLSAQQGIELSSAIGQNTSDLNAHKAEFASLLAGGDKYAIVLQNGWTGTLEYSKNDLGQVWIRGAITAGTVSLGTLIGVLPIGYRPSQNTSIVAYNVTALATANDHFVITLNGELYLRNTTAIATGNGIRFNYIYHV